MERKSDSKEEPRVLIPYTVRDLNPGLLDIFVYLRPETNGVDVESAIFSVVRSWDTPLSLQYLANLPGEFVAEHRIVERHYHDRIFFSRHGARGFSVSMRRQFETFFGTPFDEDRILGAYSALEVLGITEEDLFHLRVPDDSVTVIAGQNIKKIGSFFVVNYDIPAILLRNRRGTDIAVMMFQTEMSYHEFFEVVSRFRLVLTERHLINPEFDLSRAVHVSRGPVEQLIDTRDYLLASNGEPMGIMAGSFARYLALKGVSQLEISGIAAHPVCTLHPDTPDDDFEVVSLLDRTKGLDYEETWNVLRSVVAQMLI